MTRAAARLVPLVLILGGLSGCAAPGAEGDPCEADEDCEEGLTCHVHEDGEGACEGEDAHDEHDDTGA